MSKRARIHPTIVIYSTRLYHWLLSLGPAAFRRDYAPLAEQDFRRYCLDAYQAHGTRGVVQLWPFLFGESLHSLLAEYVSEIFGRKEPMLPTIRRSMVVTFWAFVLFSFSCIAFGRTVDPVAPFDAIGNLHPELHIAYTIINNNFKVALLAILSGGLPFLWIALQQASHKGLRGISHLFTIKLKQAFQLLLTAIVITVCFVSYLIISERITDPNHPILSGNISVLSLLFSTFVLISGIALPIFIILTITTLLSVAMLRTEFHTRTLSFALIPIAILTTTMATSTLATTFWTIRLWTVAESFAASNAGLGRGQTAWVVGIIAAMAISTIMGISALWKGWKIYQAQLV